MGYNRVSLRVNKFGIEFKIQGLPFKEQQLIEIMYKGKRMEKRYQPDFICYDDIIVEIKALSKLTGNEEAQLINYLKATGFEIGLLINFGTRSLEYKRLIHSYNPKIKHIRKIKA